MKKSFLLNQPLSAVIAGLGHTDMLVVADAGLPIPAQTQRIDLAVSCGVPSFLDTLKAVLSEMQVQQAIIADEMPAASPEAYAALRATLGDIPVSTMPHEQFKQTTRAAVAVARTGECTPYCNVILVSGVVF